MNVSYDPNVIPQSGNNSDDFKCEISYVQLVLYGTKERHVNPSKSNPKLASVGRETSLGQPCSLILIPSTAHRVTVEVKENSIHMIVFPQNSTTIEVFGVCSNYYRNVRRPFLKISQKFRKCFGG